MRTVLCSICFACLLFSCKKEEAIEPKPANNAPIANAGNDAVINIPETSYMLDGRGSYDPDKTYLEYSWRKISGPELYFFQENKNQTTALLTVREEGVYEFELKVSDLAGLSDRDTMRLTVVDNFAAGKAPIVLLFCKSLMLPSDVGGIELTANAYVEGDQSQRFDILSGFSARQIQGPSAALIQEAYLDYDRTAIPISNLTKGTYKFLVEVARKGITAHDTATVLVIDDTLKGKEFIFETKWTVNANNTVSAKTPERQDLFYMSQFRKTEVLVLFEDDPDWYEAGEGLDWDYSWLFYSTNACNSTIEIFVNDDMSNYLIGRKVKIKMKYL